MKYLCVTLLFLITVIFSPEAGALGAWGYWVARLAVFAWALWLQRKMLNPNPKC